MEIAKIKYVCHSERPKEAKNLGISRANREILRRCGQNVRPPQNDMHDFLARWKRHARQVFAAIGETIYGATIYDMVRDLNKERAQREHLFAMVVFGDLFGMPVLPPYYTLRLLPYVIPNITAWQRSMLRERDLVDLCDS